MGETGINNLGNSYNNGNSNSNSNTNSLNLNSNINKKRTLNIIHIGMYDESDSIKLLKTSSQYIFSLNPLL